ncbi:site-specific integrase [Erythrobacter tepidarius]|uniref:site-specific integrase n=1 Tax=Erythrobacter tepidarius TaxID=60454 RepID=UPI000A399FDD|nr:site-specific integrase [Erythrobacter tepidarius]
MIRISLELNREALKTAVAGRQSQWVIEHGVKRVASVKKAFQAASERSDIHVTPYTLRHTGAVWAAEAGTSMAALAQFMGHDDSVTTVKHYARFTPDYLANVAKAITRRTA